MADPTETSSSEASRDPLLSFARLVLTAALVIAALCVLALPVALIAAAVRWDDWTARLAASGIGADAAPWILLLMVLVALMFALGFFFLRHLRRIVDSVALGDPFAPVNADRLRSMAWLALAIQAIAIPATKLAIWFDAAPHRANVHHGDDGLSLGALLLVLILFVLARVFRTGAVMRDELEGTI